jgi:hypothetical protein
MGQKNLGCDIPNGTTQGWVCPTWMKFKMSYKLTILKKKIVNHMHGIDYIQRHKLHETI